MRTTAPFPSASDYVRAASEAVDGIVFRRAEIIGQVSLLVHNFSLCASADTLYVEVYCFDHVDVFLYQWWGGCCGLMC